MRRSGAAVIVLVLTLTGCTATPTMTDDELATVMELRQQSLDDLADAFGLTNPPTPDLVRWVSDEEALEVTASCLTEAGYATTASDGGLSFENLPSGELDPGGALLEAMWMCEAMYPVDPRTQVELTERQYRILYRYFDLDLRDCLASNGLTTSAAPTIDDFIAGYRNGKPWEPWLEVSMGDIGKKTWDRLQEECPPMPPAVQLYGAPLPGQP